MKSTRETILGQMAAITRMERGKLCPMRGGRYYNLQAWEKGRNVVRYVPASEVQAVRDAVEGYRTFFRLAQQYAEQVIRNTRKAAQLAGNEPKGARRENN